MKSKSDFKAHSLVVHIPYSLVVSVKFPGEELVFPFKELVSTTVALGFLHSS